MIRKGVLRECKDDWEVDFGHLTRTTLITDFYVACGEGTEVRETTQQETMDILKPYIGHVCLMMLDNEVYALDGFRLGMGYYFGKGGEQL